MRDVMSARWLAQAPSVLDDRARHGTDHDRMSRTVSSRFTDSSHGEHEPVASTRYGRLVPADDVLAHARMLVVRVWLPDRPGALGQVASRIGAVHGDVTAIDILERGAGRVIDELVVSLPDTTSVELLAKEIGAVDGVAVEHVRAAAPSVPTRLPPSSSWRPTSPPAAPADRCEALCRGLLHAADADWSGRQPRRRDDRAVRAIRPSCAWVVAFLDGSEHLDAARPANGPGDVMWARLPRLGHRRSPPAAPARAVHERERQRLALLARSSTPCSDFASSPAQQSGSAHRAMRSTARSQSRGRRRAGSRSGAGSKARSSRHCAPTASRSGHTSFGQAGEIGGAEGRRLLVDRAQHGDTELVGLLLQEQIHHRRSAIDAQLAQRRAAGPHHRLDGIAGLERHRLDDRPCQVRHGRATGDADDGAPARTGPTTATRAR